MEVVIVNPDRPLEKIIIQETPASRRKTFWFIFGTTFIISTFLIAMIVFFAIK